MDNKEKNKDLPCPFCGVTPIEVNDTFNKIQRIILEQKNVIMLGCLNPDCEAQPMASRKTWNTRY